jgi:predicted RNA binding protein YcfA (HicA-like mRNA interferase family)
MKRYKVKEIIEMLLDDGWFVSRTRGSHRQYNHHSKSGTVTVNGKPSDTLDQALLNSIFKQAGWR